MAPTTGLLANLALFLAIHTGAHAAGTGRLLQQHGTPQEARITRPAAPSPQTSALAPAPGAQSAQADLLFVQQAARAELAFDSDSPTTTAVLTLSNVSPFTTWFSDKPERRAGSLQTGFFATGAGFYTGADWLGQPNAVLTGQTARGAPVTVVLTLYSPAYNNESATLTYKATVIPAAPAEAAAAAAAARPTLVEVHGASLFVDDWGGGRGGGGGRGWYGGGGWYPWGGWWGGPTYSGNIPIRPLCPSCWDGTDWGHTPPAGTLPPAPPFPPSVNDQVPMPPVYGPSWAWEKRPVSSQSVPDPPAPVAATPQAPNQAAPSSPSAVQCSGCAKDGSGQYLCHSCTGNGGQDGGRRRML